MQQYQWWIDNVPRETDKFVGWLGTSNDISRVWFRGFVKDNNVKSVLDVACGVGIEKEGFDLERADVVYRGVDISSFLVERNVLAGYDCKLGNIEDIPEQDSSWELVYGRHIIEHLEYYEKAIEQMCRVASRYVVIVHFIPMQELDTITGEIMNGVNVFHNVYGEPKFVEYCEKFGSVVRIPLENNKQSITLIRL